MFRNFKYLLCFLALSLQAVEFYGYPKDQLVLSSKAKKNLKLLESKNIIIIFTFIFDEEGIIMHTNCLCNNNQIISYQEKEHFHNFAKDVNRQQMVQAIALSTFESLFEELVEEEANSLESDQKYAYKDQTLCIAGLKDNHAIFSALDACLIKELKARNKRLEIVYSIIEEDQEKTLYLNLYENFRGKLIEIKKKFEGINSIKQAAESALKEYLENDRKTD